MKKKEKKMDADYVLNFTIPQGPTGPTGPQGDKGEIGPTGITNTDVIGYVSQYQITNYKLEGGFTPYTLIVLQGDLGLNVKYGENGELIVLKDGCYRVEYGIIMQNFDASDQNVFTVHVGNTVNNDTTTLHYGFIQLIINDPSSYVYFSIPYLVNLNAGDYICITIASDKAGTFYCYSPYILAYRLSDKIGRIPPPDDTSQE